MATATLIRRVKRLEQAASTNSLESIPTEILDRIVFLDSKWFATGDLEPAEKAERLRLWNSPECGGGLGPATTEDLEKMIQSERSDPDARKETQHIINQLAELDADYQEFASEVTWAGAPGVIKPTGS